MSRISKIAVWLAIVGIGCILPFATMADEKVVPLMSKRGGDVGTVTVKKEGDNLVVSVNSDKKVRKVHIDVAASADGLHFNKAGKPKLGKFLFKGKGNAKATVDASGLSGEVFVAVFARVNGKGKAWAGENGNKYFSYMMDVEEEEEVVQEEVAEEPVVQTGLVQFQASSYVAQEVLGNATITIERVSGSEGSVSVNYNTVELPDGGAIEGFDYVASNGVVTFRPGETSASIVIQVPNDNMLESAQESFGIVLSGDCCLGDISETRIIIEDAPMSTDGGDVFVDAEIDPLLLLMP